MSLKDCLEQVKVFHVRTNQPVLPRPAVPPHDRVRLRASLIMEEAFECIGALFGFSDFDVKRIVHQNNYLMQHIDPQCQLKATAKELADLIYVCLGAAAELGIPIDEVFEAVHANNMTKIDGPILPGGKRGKPDGYVPCDVGSILDAYL